MDKLQFDYLSSIVQGIDYCPSPNHDERPDITDVSLLVIHNISLPPGEFGQHHIQDFFCNMLDPKKHPFFKEIAKMRVSAHFLIERNGKITQFVPLEKRAWHAGQSCYEGRERCNDFSIGIELEGTDDTPYTDAQYQSLTHITHVIMKAFPLINSDRITGHKDIAPQRKTDPGPAFDWQRYLNAL